MLFNHDYYEDEMLHSVWSLVNNNCTDKQRDKFNEFRGHLYKNADSLRDWVRRRSRRTEKEVPIPEEMDRLIEAICAIASLEK